MTARRPAQIELDWIRPFLDALSDPELAVRQAALRTVVRLELDGEARQALDSRLGRALDKALQHLGEPAAGGTTDLDPLEEQRLPLWELLAAALYLPDPGLRWKIRQFRHLPLPQAQAKRLDGLLIQAADEPTILETWDNLDPRRPGEWAPIAALLYRLHSPADLDKLSQAAANARPAQLRFWLCLALARWDDFEPLRGFLESWDPASDLEAWNQIRLGLWQDFAVAPARLFERPPFYGEFYIALDEWLHANPGNLLEEELTWLLQSRQLDQSAEKPGEAKPPYHLTPSEPSADLLTALEQGTPLYVDLVLGQTAGLSTAQAARLVSLTFAYAQQSLVGKNYSPNSFTGGELNQNLVYLLEELGPRFQPELARLFQLYLDLQGIPKKRWGGLDRQIIQTAARAGMPAVLQAIAPRLYAVQVAERLAAIEFIRRANLECRLLGQEPVYLRDEGMGAGDGGLSLPDLPPPGLPLPTKSAEPGPVPAPPPEGSELFPVPSPNLSYDLDQRPVVNTGFSQGNRPDRPLLPTTPLYPDSAYYFLFWIGEPSRYSGETSVTGLPETVQAGELLEVTLVGYHDGLQIDPQRSSGLLRATAGGYAQVERQPLGDQGPQDSITLYFPLRTPARPGRYAMRCNLYYRGLLIQSRRVSARVMAKPLPQPTRKPAWQSDLDYHLSSPGRAAEIKDLPVTRLSLQLNANPDGSNSFHLRGADGVEQLKQDDLRFGEGELHGMIQQARQVLQLASWGKPTDWAEGLPFKYQDRSLNWTNLASDLVNLAKWGRMFYTTIADRLAGGADARRAFQELMRTPGFVQIALKGSPSYILPAALIYDYPLDPGCTEPYKLCKEFIRVMTAGEDLESSACFQGRCPTIAGRVGKPKPCDELMRTVCPGGFWGFRHYLGLPLALDERSEAPFEIPYAGKPALLMGEYRDFELVDDHKSRLSQLAVQFSAEADRNKLLEHFQGEPGEIIYFYCHGGLVREAPYLVVGSKAQRGLIQTSNFQDYEIRWEGGARPLVFLNGCHTSAVDPLAALTLLRGFVVDALAAGLIGTEITIYEEMASDFAEAFFPRFLAGQTAGEALRAARLVLLKQGNPLGLVYTPFVQAGLRLKQLGGAPGIGGAGMLPQSPGPAGPGGGMGESDDGPEPLDPTGLGFGLPGG